MTDQTTGLAGNWGDGHKTQSAAPPTQTLPANSTPVNPHFEAADHSDMQELLEIQDLMRQDINSYFANPEIESRHRELLDRVGPNSAAAATSDPIEVAALVDRDVPPNPSAYQIDDSKFARGSFKAGDRAAFEQAFSVAYSEGIGQNKFNDAVGYLATRSEYTADAFAAWAIDRGWPDAHILAAIDLGQRNKLFSGD